MDVLLLACEDWSSTPPRKLGPVNLGALPREGDLISVLSPNEEAPPTEALYKVCSVKFIVTEGLRMAGQEIEVLMVRHPPVQRFTRDSRGLPGGS
jgi:hypothetical protein